MRRMGTLQLTRNGRTTTFWLGETTATSNVPSSPVAANPELSRPISSGLRNHQPSTCQNRSALRRRGSDKDSYVVTPG
jgi:hypothetical protein